MGCIGSKASGGSGSVPNGRLDRKATTRASSGAMIFFFSPANLDLIPKPTPQCSLSSVRTRLKDSPAALAVLDSLELSRSQLNLALTGSTVDYFQVTNSCTEYVSHLKGLQEALSNSPDLELGFTWMIGRDVQTHRISSVADEISVVLVVYGTLLIAQADEFTRAKLCTAHAKWPNSAAHISAEGSQDISSLPRFSLDIWQAVHTKLVKAAGVFELCRSALTERRGLEELEAVGITAEFCGSLEKGCIAAAEELQLAVALGQMREEQGTPILATRLLACAIHERWSEADSHKEENTFVPEWYDWCKNKSLLSSAYALRQYGLQLDEEDRKGCHGDAAACLRDARDNAIQARASLAKMGATSPQELLEIEANLVKEASKLEKFAKEIYSEQVSVTAPPLPTGKSKIVAIEYEFPRIASVWSEEVISQYKTLFSKPRDVPEKRDDKADE